MCVNIIFTMNLFLLINFIERKKFQGEKYEFMWIWINLQFNQKCKWVYEETVQHSKPPWKIHEPGDMLRVGMKKKRIIMNIKWISYELSYYHVIILLLLIVCNILLLNSFTFYHIHHHVKIWGGRWRWWEWWKKSPSHRNLYI